MYKHFFKRVIDIFISFLGILILIIPMIIIGIIVKIDSKGPALFKQKRVGKRQKQFTVLKYRTMCDHAYEIGGVVSSENDLRITKVGKFLRRTSLDEIPQLFNIFIGQMSIIGPRPILDWEFEENNKREDFVKRFNIRPGLFCTVDVKNRAATKIEQFEMDVEYVNKVGFVLDVKTFFGVIKTVITGKGVYKDENPKYKEDE